MTALADEQQLDPRLMSLDELRCARKQLQSEDDAVSYVRRISQARLDIVRCYIDRLADNTTTTITTESDVAEHLCEVLARSLTGPSTRATRPIDDLENHPLVAELDGICTSGGFSRIDDLSIDELNALEQQLDGFERRVSFDRQERYGLLDALNAELIGRYRDGDVTLTM